MTPTPSAAQPRKYVRLATKPPASATTSTAVAARAVHVSRDPHSPHPDHRRRHRRRFVPRHRLPKPLLHRRDVSGSSLE